MQLGISSWPPVWVSKYLCTTPSSVVSHHVLETTPWFSSQHGVLSADLLEKLGWRLEAWKLILKDKDQWTMHGWKLQIQEWKSGCKPGTSVASWMAQKPTQTMACPFFW